MKEIIDPRFIYDEDKKKKNHHKNHRRASLRFSTKKQEEWYKLLHAAGIVPLTEGWLKIRRWIKEDRSRLKISWFKLPNIDNAIRMQDHILEKYRTDNVKKKSELSKIRNVEELITYANSLLSTWSSLDKKLQKNVEYTLTEVVSCLHKCRNEFLKKTKDQSGKASKIIDSRGRVNPGAMAARTIAALNSIVERMNQLEIIIPFIAMRRELLILEKNKMISEINLVKKSTIVATKHIAFTSKATKPQIVNLGIKIGQLINQLEQIHISPYFDQVCLAGEHLKKAKLALNKYHFMQSKEYLLIAVNIMEHKFED